MLVNTTTGEIAYHSMLLKPEGGIEVIQHELKDTDGDILYIEPK